LRDGEQQRSLLIRRLCHRFGRTMRHVGPRSPCVGCRPPADGACPRRRVPVCRAADDQCRRMRGSFHDAVSGASRTGPKRRWESDDSVARSTRASSRLRPRRPEQSRWIGAPLSVSSSIIAHPHVGVGRRRVVLPRCFTTVGRGP
jgi:hypothetical protein